MNNIDWKKAVVFLIVIGGLIYITKAELGMTTTKLVPYYAGYLVASLYREITSHRRYDDDRKTT